jgi:hypothetical protein
LPEVAVRITEYVPAGVPCVDDVLLPPQPATPRALNKRNAMEIRPRFCMVIIRKRLPKHKTPADALPSGKRHLLLFMTTADLRVVVPIVTLNGTVAEPLTLSGLGFIEHVAAVGNPVQEKTTDPEKPFTPVTARL